MATPIIDLCDSDGLCMEAATKALTLVVSRKGVRGIATRTLKACDRHAKLIEDRAEKRRREQPDLTITLEAIDIIVPK